MDMNLNFDTQLVVGYHSKSQVARVLTEDWVRKICTAQGAVVKEYSILKTTDRLPIFIVFNVRLNMN